MTFRHAYMPQTCPKCLSVCSKVTENDLRARCLEICENMSGLSRFSNMLIARGLVKSRVENRLLNTGVWHMFFCILLIVSLLWFKAWQILRAENRDWQFLHLYRRMPLRTPHLIASRDPQWDSINAFLFRAYHPLDEPFSSNFCKSLNIIKGFTNPKCQLYQISVSNLRLWVCLREIKKRWSTDHLF